MQIIIKTPVLSLHRLARWCNELYGTLAPGYPDSRIKRIVEFQFWTHRGRYYGILLVEVTTGEEQREQAPVVEVCRSDEGNQRVQHWQRVGSPWMAIVWLPNIAWPVVFEGRTGREAERTARGWLKKSRISE